MTANVRVTLDSTELLLAGRLLALAAREFHEHGCNDMDMALFQDIGIGSRAAMLAAWNRWAGQEREFQSIPDDGWMDWLAERLMAAGGER